MHTNALRLLLAIVATGCTHHAVLFDPHPKDGRLYIRETKSFLWFPTDSAVLRCFETEGSRTECTRLTFVVADKLTAKDCAEAVACAEDGRCVSPRATQPVVQQPNWLRSTARV